MYTDFMRTLPKKQSQREKQVLKALKDYHATHGWMPTTREIGGILGIEASGVPEYLARLEARGLIKREAGLSPRIQIIDT